jgi:hypothetical protein
LCSGFLFPKTANPLPFFYCQCRIWLFYRSFQHYKKGVSPTEQTTKELHNEGVVYVLNKYIKIVTAQQKADAS